jgi:ribosomal protein S14
LILRHRVKVLRRRSRTPVPKAWYRRGFLCRLWFRLNAYTGADASAFEGRRAGRRL